VEKNRRLWQAQSAEYDRRFAKFLGGDDAMAWGFERVPESELGLLGPVRDRDVLELGCGAARWSVGLARRGARAVGLDVSSAQLLRAREEIAAAGVDVRLVEASAESVPLRSRSFDIVFCDWGAMTFCDPRRTVPEAARLLRPGGWFVFSTANPIAMLARDPKADRIRDRFTRDYFGLHRIDFTHEVSFQLPFGEWIALFVENGLRVESLTEPRIRWRKRSPYLTREEFRWGKRWPLEAIWRLRKTGEWSAPTRSPRRPKG
jgi:SAM-dependent methyltransferase